jgi:bacterial/archaeal transporter family-2 protein
MNTILLIAAAFVIGCSIPLQVALNSQLGGVTGSPVTSGLIAFLIGALTLAALWLALRPALPVGATLAAAPKSVWFGGVLAAFYLASVVTVAPKLGIGLTTTLILVGQLVTAMAIDHYGAFGSPHQAMNLWRLGGLALMVAGVVMVKTH